MPKYKKEVSTEEGQDKLIAYVNEAFEESKQAKTREAQEWKVDYQMFKGYQDIRYSPKLRQLFTMAPFLQKPLDAVANLIWGYVWNNTAQLVTDKPFLGVLPATNQKEDLYAAKVIRKVFESLWHQQRLGMKIADAGQLASIYGTGFIKVLWDPDAGRGGYDSERAKHVYEGDICFENLSVWDVFPDPRATCVDDARYLVHAKPVHIQEVKDRYGIEVEPDNAVSASMEEEFLILQESDVTTADNVMEVKDHVVKRQQMKKTPKGGYVLLKECWTKDYVTTVAGNHLLRREKNEVGMLPFFAIYDFKETRKFWGVGEPRPLRDLQRRFNQLLTQILQNVKGSNSKILRDESATVRGAITTEPWQEITYTGNPPIFQPGTPVSADLFNSLDRIKRLMDEVSNQTRIDPISLTKSNISGRFVEAYQQVSNAPLRYKQLVLQDSLIQMGRYLLKLMQLKFDQPRMYKYLGDNNAPAFVEISKDQIKAGTDVYFNVQSTLPQLPMARQELALQLTGAKIITPQQALQMIQLSGLLNDQEEESLNVERDPGQTIRDAETENDMVAKGQMPVVLPMRLEDTEAHIKLHYQYLQTHLIPGSKEERLMHMLIAREERIIGNIQPIQQDVGPQEGAGAPNPLGIGGPQPGQQPLPNPNPLPPQSQLQIPQGA